MKLTAVSLLVLTCLSRELEAQNPLLHWLNNIAQQQLKQRESTIAQIHTVAEANRRKQLVREKLLQILGGLPNYSGPLNARITGSIRTDSYTIENVIFESLPGFYVTGNLWIPCLRFWLSACKLLAFIFSRGLLLERIRYRTLGNREYRFQCAHEPRGRFRPFDHLRVGLHVFIMARYWNCRTTFLRLGAS